MIVAVTGSTGHIGGNLVRALLTDGESLRVRALVHDDDARTLAGLDVERVACDVRDASSVDAALAGAQVVYHLAARISVDGDRDGQVRAVNVEGTRNVLAACRAHGVRRVVHFSSIHALDPRPLDAPVDETRPLYDVEGALAYERSKAAGEKLVLAAAAEGLDAVIVNPTAVIGPHDYRPSQMGSVMLDLARRKMPALVAGGFDWVDVRDVVSGALAAERDGRTGERYLLGSGWRSVADLASLVARSAGVRAPRFVSPMWLARVSAPVAALAVRATRREARFTGESLKALTHWLDVSHAKAARELGYAPRPLDVTVDDTIAWFRSAGLLGGA